MKKTMAKIGARDALRIFSPIEFLTEFMREKTRCSRGSLSISLSAAFASESDQLPASLNDSEAKKLITLARPSGMLMFEAVTTSLENITFQLNESSMILAKSVWASPRTQGRQSPPWSRSIKNDAISSGFRAPPLAARQGIKNTIRNNWNTIYSDTFTYYIYWLRSVYYYGLFIAISNFEYSVDFVGRSNPRTLVLLLEHQRV